MPELLLWNQDSSSMALSIAGARGIACGVGRGQRKGCCWAQHACLRAAVHFPRKAVPHNDLLPILRHLQRKLGHGCANLQQVWLICKG